MANPGFHFHDRHPAQADFRAEVLAGLRQPRKAIAPKFFYDRRGSQLFDAICELPEYYPTRTELGILERVAEEIATLCGEASILVELGSGSSQKVRLLLDSLRPAAYLPLDISREHLWESARTLSADYPWLAVHAVCLDFSQPFTLPELPGGRRRIAFFPGSSIGNFNPQEATRFLRQVRHAVGDDGALLIGVDLKKDPAVLHRAYNDASGVTAAFNLNLLERINRELDGNFDLDRFRHEAYYDPGHGRIEMHLVSLCRQSVQIDGEAVEFELLERMHTENSYKYRVEEFASLAGAAGFRHRRTWTDAHEHFSVQFYESHPLRTAMASGHKGSAGLAEPYARVGAAAA